MPSGVTHDALAMSGLCPIAMLFTHCKSGLSHHPDEYANAADMGTAIDAITKSLQSGITRQTRRLQDGLFSSL
ncbi:M20/M25/M40 family metallo-hydrolase [uncultured Aliiroseovarius sp.]|uniref:M20/M25/M40 family metallo-hydrolase n=1 Tax=uncultured Aliiroseovarius sp. TaxID=1658783 RepID=UPI0025927ACB|nr:M20/M25/M40 family metallo-hydrolase [uncultured Aliiroseovarius sp.]